MYKRQLTAIQEGINGILGFLSSIASEIDFEEIAANIQSVTSFFLDLVNGVRSGSMSLGEAFLEIKRKAGELFYSLLEELKNSLPEILSIGMEMVQELISGIMSEAPGLIAEATELLASFLDELLSNLPVSYTHLDVYKRQLTSIALVMLRQLRIQMIL